MLLYAVDCHMVNDGCKDVRPHALANCSQDRGKGCLVVQRSLLYIWTISCHICCVALLLSRVPAYMLVCKSFYCGRAQCDSTELQVVPLRGLSFPPFLSVQETHLALGQFASSVDLF